MPSWESLIRVTRADTWGTPGTVANRGIFLYADSENLSYGAEAVERDNKILGNRISPVDTFSVDRYVPRGQITFQPRVDDLLPILMAHFQNVDVSGTGTYTFFHSQISPDFGGAGSFGQFRVSGTGSCVYSVNVDVYFGNSFTATGANGIRFTNGIVDRLEFNLRYGEDMQCTPDFKFLNGTYNVYPAGYTYPSAFGSMSAYSRFVDYLGTATISGKSYDIDSWQGVFMNNSSDKTRIGRRGYNRFPFSGKAVAEGQFEMTLQDDLAALAEQQYATLTVELWQAAGNRIQFFQPNIVYRPFDIPLNSGAEDIVLTKPYRAYGQTGSATYPTTFVRVYTGTTFGTHLFGF